MPFRAGLTTQDANNPVAWKMYALATLIRIVSTGNLTSLAAWKAWAGGTVSQLWVQPPSSIASNVGAVTDGTTAIIAYAGTRDGRQLLGQIGGSVQLPFFGARGSANAGQRLIWTRTYLTIFDWVGNHVAPGATVLLCGTSLGGACACMMANYLSNAGYTCVVFTTGQPRVGNSTFNGFVSGNWLRLINETDPVTAVPPESDTMNIVVGGVTQSVVEYTYRHGGISQGMILGNDGFADLRTPYQPTELDALQGIVAAIVQTASFTNAFLQYHAIEQYIVKISRLKDYLSPTNPSLVALEQINAILNGTLPQPPTPPVAPVLNPVDAGRLQDPNVVINDGDPPLAIPPTDVGRRAEGRRTGVTPNPPLFNTPIFSLAQRSEQLMAAFLKCTFNFRQLGQAWSETYVHAGDSIATLIGLPSTANPANKVLQQLATSMMSLRGPQCSLTSIRISLFNLPITFPKPRVSYLLRLTPPIVGTYSTAPADSDFFDTCIVFQMTAASGVPPKLTHARGFPDSYVTAGGAPVSSLETFFGPAYTSPQNGFPAVLKADGWSWAGRGVIRQGNITNLQQDDAGTVTITTTTGTLLTGLSVNQAFPFRISGVTKPKSINGVWPFVVNADLLSITTKKLFGILPWDQGRQGRITYNPQQVNAIADVRFNNIGERKAGRPSDLQRGRQPNRLRD